MYRVLLAVVFVLGGCSSDDPPSTPEGGTSTTPGINRTASEIVAGFKQALPIAETKDFTAADDPNEQLGRPGGYTSKTSWHDSRLEAADFDVDGGGSVEVFATEDEAKKRIEYIDSVTKSSPMLNEYHWAKGIVVLRVAKGLTPDQAEEYHSAL